MMDFESAHVALLCEGCVVVILRDDTPSISFPNFWDLTGGGREGGETPEETAMRETREEVGLTLAAGDLVWKCAFPAFKDPTRQSFLFVAELSPEDIEKVVFGDEGQRWKLMDLDEFFADEQAVPFLKNRLREYVDECKEEDGRIEK